MATPVITRSCLALAFSVLPALAGDGFTEGCYRRDYDQKHLAEHPQQTVVAMSLELLRDGEPRAPAFELKVRLRGQAEMLVTGGACRRSEGAWRCSVVCDGGGVAITYPDSSSVMVRLDEPFGYIRFFGCGSDDDVGDFPDDGFDLHPGIDDKIFLLHSTGC